MNPLVIYRDSIDGFTAAWVVSALPDFAHADFVPQPAIFPPSLPEQAGKTVIIAADYPRDELEAFSTRADSLIVLEYRPEVLGNVQGLPFTLFRSDLSAASLAWLWFKGDNRFPRFIQYIEDAEKERWALLRSKEIASALLSYEKDFASWDHLSTKFASPLGFQNLSIEGAAIQRYQKLNPPPSGETVHESELLTRQPEDELGRVQSRPPDAARGRKRGGGADPQSVGRPAGQHARRRP